jgi:hypothetical protein
MKRLTRATSALAIGGLGLASLVTGVSAGPASADTLLHAIEVNVSVSELVDYDAPDPSDVCTNLAAITRDTAQLPSDPKISIVKSMPRCDEALLQVRVSGTLLSNGVITGTVTTTLFEEDCFLSCGFDTVPTPISRSFTMRQGEVAFVSGRIDDHNQAAASFSLSLRHL